MAKKKQTQKYPPRLIAVLAGILLLVIGIVGVTKVYVYDRYRATEDAASMVAIRELILSAAQGLKPPAPIDAKTGDVYFPEARLYLATDNETNLDNQFTYTYSKTGEHGAELSVSTKLLFSGKATKLYSARNIHEMFSHIPEFQACIRGVRIIEKDSGLEDVPLLEKISVADGRTLYMYGENACQDLADTAKRLTNLKSF